MTRNHMLLLMISLLAAALPATGRAAVPAWEQKTLPWHDAAIAGVAASADGRVVATIARDGSLRLWSMPEGRLLRRLDWDASTEAPLLAMAPDGSEVALVEGKDGALVRHALAAGGSDRLALDRVSALSYGPAGTLAVATVGGGLHLLPKGGAAAGAPLKVAQTAYALAWGPAEKVLLVAGGDEFGFAELWDPAKRERLRPLSLDTETEAAHESAYFQPPFAAALSADGELAVVGAGPDVIVWKSANGKRIVTLTTDPERKRFQLRASAVAFAADGDTVVAELDNALVAWSLSSQQLLWRRALPQTYNGLAPGTMVLWPDGDRVLFGDADGRVVLQGLRSGERIARIEGVHSMVVALAFRPETALLAAGHTDGTVSLWTASTGQRSGAPLAAHRKRIEDLAWSPDGRLLATASADGTAVLWDPTARKAAVTLRGHTGPVAAVTFSPDGKLVATGGADRSIRLWSAEDGRELRVLEGHTDAVTDLSFRLGGERLASVSEDGSLRVWDVESGKQLLLARVDKGGAPFTSVAYSPDGVRIATGEAFMGDSAVRYWEAEPLRQVARLEGTTLGAHDLAFGPVTGHLYGSCLDAKTLVWDPPNPKPIAVLKGYDGYGLAVAVSSDERFAVMGSGGNETALRIWERR